MSRRERLPALWIGGAAPRGRVPVLRGLRLGEVWGCPPVSDTRESGVERRDYRDVPTARPIEVPADRLEDSALVRFEGELHVFKEASDGRVVLEPVAAEECSDCGWPMDRDTASGTDRKGRRIGVTTEHCPECELYIDDTGSVIRPDTQDTGVHRRGGDGQ